MCFQLKIMTLFFSRAEFVAAYLCALIMIRELGKGSHSRRKVDNTDTHNQLHMGGEYCSHCSSYKGE
jgi:hypothetical protein